MSEEKELAVYKKERNEFLYQFLIVFLLVVFVFAIGSVIALSFYAHKRIDRLQDKIEKLQVKKRVPPQFIK